MPNDILFYNGRITMIGRPMKTGVVAAMGLILLIGQGCSMKWLQSDGETESASGQKLTGFSKNPTEERLGKGGDIVSLSPSSMSARQRAEITKEEKAAIEAGLQDVFFGYNEWALSDAGMEALNGDARWLKDHPGAVMKVEGHCDERGTADYNIVLGDKRAKAARSYLIESGVAPKQVAIVSYGKARPFCTDPAETCYQQNRRGHVLLNVKK
jgi:peptidoglycan-associated lipoprotein